MTATDVAVEDAVRTIVRGATWSSRICRAPCSAGLEEVSWVLTSYLAANAVIIPATGWVAGLLGRKRFFLICAALFRYPGLLRADSGRAVPSHTL